MPYLEMGADFFSDSLNSWIENGKDKNVTAGSQCEVWCCDARYTAAGDRTTPVAEKNWTGSEMGDLIHGLHTAVRSLRVFLKTHYLMFRIGKRCLFKL
jgi:hypothetical protein